MKVTIARVSENLYQGEAYSLTVPGSSGEMTILGQHMPLVSTLKKGVISVKENREAEGKKFSIGHGVIEVSGNSATVLL